jgi:hypothetical protein
MPGRPFLGMSDHRPHVLADLYESTGRPVHLSEDFVIDTGAGHSALDSSNAVNLPVVGALGVYLANGPQVQAPTVDACLAVDVEDQGGQVQQRIYPGPFAVLSRNLIGMDMAQSLGFCLTVDYRTYPASAALLV